MCHGWRYCNHKVANHVAFMGNANDVLDVIRALTGHVADKVFDATTGESPFGPYREADIEYRTDGTRYELSYDFIYEDLESDGTARVFRMALDCQGRA